MKSKSILTATVALGVTVPATAGFDTFEGVQFLLPIIREAYMDDAQAMELADGRMIGTLSTVGVPFAAQHSGQAVQLSDNAAFWGSTSFLRTSYTPKVVNAQGEEVFQLGKTEDLDRQYFDFAHESKRLEAAKAMQETIASVDSDWIMFDEPSWGFRGMDNPEQLPLSTALRERVSSRVGRDFSGVSAFEEDPKVWRAFVIERQRAIAEALELWTAAAHQSGRKVTVNHFPAAMESGAVSGFEIATAMQILGDDVDQIAIDPYYALFVEDPRFAGFMLRMVDDNTPRDVPMLGWIDSVDGLDEKLSIKNPTPESMKPQMASYLANGADHLAVWAHGYLHRLKTADAYQEMTRWIRQHQALYRGNPRMASRTGLYYSNATVAMHDYFPRAWSHGTGPFGQYFTALNTYYMLTATQTPVRVVSLPFGDEAALSDKLSELDRLVLVDATVMSDSEVQQISDWVRGGGTLLVIGQPGVLDDYGRAREGGLLGLAGVQTTPVTPRQGLIFGDAWPGKAPSAAQVELEGSNESEFVRRYRTNRAYALNYHDKRARYYLEKWPLHLRDSPLESTRQLSDPEVSDWTPRGAPGFAPGGKGEVWASYTDGEPAILRIALGEGQIVAVAPTDWLTRYRDPAARSAARGLFDRVLADGVEIEGGDEATLAAVELVVNERRQGGERAVIVHLIRHVHDDQAILTEEGPLRDLSIRFSLEPGERVLGLSAHSPDQPEMGIEYTQQGDQVEITLPTLDIYTAALLRVTRNPDALRK